jgi:acyl-CoA dehydrogenase
LLSFLYMQSAVFKYFQVEATASEEQPIFHWCMQRLFYQFEVQLDQLLLNLPKCLAYFLRLMTLPFGKRLKPPRDDLLTKVAKLLLTPNPVRQRLTEGAYSGPGPHQPLYHLEEFLLQMIAVEPHLKKMKQNELSQEERDQVALAEKARMEFIAVDVFE